MNVQPSASVLAEYAFPETHRGLSRISRLLPCVDRTLKQYGDASLNDYVRQAVTETRTCYQPRGDLYQAVFDCAAPLLGVEVASKVRDTLSQSPVVLTANHHGIDFFAQSVQSTLLFGLNRQALGLSAIPVLACASVPMNNLTYPRGLVCYGNAGAQGYDPVHKIPLFSNRFRRRMVSWVPGYDHLMVKKARQESARMGRENQLSSAQVRTVNTLLDEDYSDPDILQLKRYSDQAVVLNARIWRRMFTSSLAIPTLVSLELESVIGKLVEMDLEDPRSLLCAILYDTELRKLLLAALEGLPGCWRQEQLARRAQAIEGASASVPQGCGTFLFWGIDGAGRRIPLLPGRSAQGSAILSGTIDTGERWEIGLDHKELLQGVRDRRLLPSVFTCLMELAFARGFNCLGGYYQADYLPKMQRGLLQALDRSHDHAHLARYVAQVPTDSYLSGMQAVMCVRDNSTHSGGLVPAGPVEMIAKGGLNGDDILRIQSLSVRDAHIASLCETLTDAEPEYSSTPAFNQLLPYECQTQLQDKAVIYDSSAQIRG